MFLRRLHVPLRTLAFHRRVDMPARHIASGVTDGIRWFDSHASSQYRPLGLYGVTLTLLGSGSAFPSPWRNVSCSVIGVHEQGTLYVFDCGEASQHQISSSSPLYLSCVLNGGIFISHFHGDHIFGLPGIISGVLLNYKEWRAGEQQTSKKRSGGKSAKGKRLRIFGPPGLHAFICNILSTAHQSSVYQHLPIDVYELHPRSLGDTRSSARRGSNSSTGGGPGSARARGSAATTRHSSRDTRDQKGPVLHILYPEEDGSHVCIDNDHHKIVAAPLQHTSPCFGFVYSEKNKVHLLPEKLKKHGIVPGRETLPLMRDLKNGKAVTNPLTGKLIHPHQVQRAGSKGRKIALFFDTSSPSPVALKLSEDADLLLHEATLPPGAESRAATRGHSTPIMAGKVAAAVRAKRLVLNHFGGGSPAMLYPREASMTFLGLREAMLKQQQSPPRYSGIPSSQSQSSSSLSPTNANTSKHRGHKNTPLDLSDQFQLLNEVANGTSASSSSARNTSHSAFDDLDQRSPRHNAPHEQRHTSFQSLCPTQTTILQGIFEEEHLASMATSSRTAPGTEPKETHDPPLFTNHRSDPVETNARSTSIVNNGSTDPSAQVTYPSRRFPPRGITYVQEFAFPPVQETMMASKLSEEARNAAAAAGWTNLKAICARDFMTIVVPPPSEDWGVRGPMSKTEGMENDSD